MELPSLVRSIWPAAFLSCQPDVLSQRHEFFAVPDERREARTRRERRNYPRDHGHAPGRDRESAGARVLQTAGSDPGGQLAPRTENSYEFQSDRRALYFHAGL